MSYKTEVLTEGKWYSNGQRFATEDEARRAGHELLSRWLVPIDSRPAPSDDPVNYIFPVGTDRPQMIEPMLGHQDTAQ